MQEMFLSDNSGNRISHPQACDPVAASGITLSGGDAGSDVTQAVEQGVMYAITFPIDSGNWLFSTTGVTSTAANREWIGVEGTTIIIRIPIDKTTLYFECDVAAQSAYMRKLAD